MPTPRGRDQKGFPGIVGDMEATETEVANPPREGQKVFLAGGRPLCEVEVAVANLPLFERRVRRYF